MMRNRAILASALIALLAGNVNFAYAQNPLRVDGGRQPSQSSGNPSILNRILDSPVDGAGVARNQSGYGKPLPPPTDEMTRPVTHYDANVVSASYLPEPEYTNVETENGTTPADAPNFIEREHASVGDRERSGSQSSPQNLGLLISKIGMNLAFVLSLATGFVLVAKRWLKSKSKSTRMSPTSDGLQVKEVLVLDSKTTLRLVQWRMNRILVACDANGIKSVNILNPTFDQTLDELSNDLSPAEPSEPVTTRVTTKSGIDENLLRRLLENAQAQQAQNFAPKRQGAA